MAKWTALRIPAGAMVMRMTDEGQIEMDPVQVEVSLNMWPHWLDVSLRHMKQAAEAHKYVLAAHATKDQEVLHDRLNEEFQASMQAVAAAAFTIDALYGALDSVVQVPQTTKDRWTQNRISRSKRVAEVIRLGCVIANGEFKVLHKGIATVFKYRDEAVHPASRFHEPLLRPELNVGVDPRFLIYSASNAQTAVLYAVEALLDVYEMPRIQGPDDTCADGTEAAIVHDILDTHGVTISRQTPRLPPRSPTPAEDPSPPTP